ncbi:MAG TPA: DinB family protein [Acidobacteriota bacterium]|jgi:uncharacterized damage-inducible protein DinB
MTNNWNHSLRTLLEGLLDWQDAHANFDAAVAGVPPELRGVRPAGLPYSLWQLLEHMRLCQKDILDFCRNPDYKELKIEEYWPSSDAPPNASAWDKSVAAIRSDFKALKEIARDPNQDLFATIPHGTGQTYLRELLLVADHNAYHLGQFVILRRLLGIWKPA